MMDFIYKYWHIGLPIIILFVVVMLLRNKTSRNLKTTLVDKKQISHDTFILTFILPNQKQPLGLKIGQHIEIQAQISNQIIKRKYTPISKYNKKGSFQLLVKVYKPCQKFQQGGKMTQYLDELLINQQINIQRPFGKLNYLGNKQFLIKNINGDVRRKYENVYLIGGGTGITPLYQIIQYVTEEQKKQLRPNITLLFANKSQSDILLQKQLKDFQAINPKFKVYFSVDVPSSDSWAGYRGFIDENKIKQTIPSDIKKTLFLSCGPPPLCNLVDKLLIGFKVPFEQIYRF